MICSLESAFWQRRGREQLGGPPSRMGPDSWAESVPGSERAPRRALADRVGCGRAACLPGVPSLPARSPRATPPASASCPPLPGGGWVGSLGPGPAPSAGACHRELLYLSPCCAYGNN